MPGRESSARNTARPKLRMSSPRKASWSAVGQVDAGDVGLLVNLAGPRNSL